METPIFRGRIHFVLHEDGLGIIETPDGERLGFRWDDVEEDAFDLLDTGCEVTYIEVQDSDGRRASTVRLARAASRAGR